MTEYYTTPEQVYGKVRYDDKHFYIEGISVKIERTDRGAHFRSIIEIPRLKSEDALKLKDKEFDIDILRVTETGKRQKTLDIKTCRLFGSNIRCLSVRPC